MDSPRLRQPEVNYPESDGKPLAESDLHVWLLTETRDSVHRYFQDVPDVYVSGNIFVYFEEGDPRKCVSPDFFLVRGVRKGNRRVYKIWEEGKGPEVVIEFTSDSTHREDRGDKRGIYEELGVKEYFLFDPTADWLDPPLKGFRLRDGVFESMEGPRVEGDALVLASEVLGLELVARGESLRLRESATGYVLPTARELGRVVEERRQLAEAERARAEAERKRAEAAEAEVARLRDELSRLREKRNG